jgi:[ribosomal protein S18]-alanine N-acetyltransferase
MGWQGCCHSRGSKLKTFDEDTPGSLVTILPATWRDLNSLRHLEQVCFPKDAWPLLDMVGVLALPNVVRLKAQVGESFAGFVAGDVHSRKNEAWIATIAVLPEFRRQGIGRELLRSCERNLDVSYVRLCVRASNTVAENLYLSEGYQRARLWEKYYQDGENALVMEKELRG